jgi:hypothetical protein
MSQQLGITTAESYQAEAPAHAVVVKDIDMPFWSMCRFMVKWSIAAIPAAIILVFVFGFTLAIFAALFGGLFRDALH